MIKDATFWAIRKVAPTAFMLMGLGGFTVTSAHYFVTWYAPIDAKLTSGASNAWGSNPLEMMASDQGFKLVKHKITDKDEIYRLIDKSATKFHVHKCAARSIANIESSDNKNRISKAGALGMMQIMPFNVKTADEREALIDNDEFNIEKGVEHYAEDLRAMGGDETLAAQRYNCGPGCFGPGARLPAETRDYAVRFKSALATQCRATGGK